jgi:death on curing protein
MTAHLTLGDILDIRDRVGAHEPERFAVANSAGLLTALTTPFQGAYGQEAFPTLLDKAAALAFFLVNNHPFYDGNKRIAAAALRLFLERNAAPLRADDEALDELTYLLTTTHDPRDPQVLGWIATRIS